MKRFAITFTALISCLSFSFPIFGAYTSRVITLEQAISLALQNDPWLHGSELKQKAAIYRSSAARTWSSPKVSLNMMNLPTNSWSFDQEAMTQVNVGVSQVLPRGNSLAIKESQLKIEASKFALLRDDRIARLKTIVSELWLDAYLAQQTIALIESDRMLFEQMAEVARASYSSALGNMRQQDVIRAELEIIQLEDRVVSQKQLLESATAQLSEWFHLYDNETQGDNFNFNSPSLSFSVAETLPAIELAVPEAVDIPSYVRERMAQILVTHPALKAIEQKRKVFEKSTELARQQYKPQWGVNASYGYRDDMQSGQSRADFFSVGVSFDVPLFTQNRQDKEVAASIADSQAVKTEKLLLTKQMLSALETEIRQLVRLRERQTLYKQGILLQTNEQAEASLTAYTNDDGDFSEVVRARIAVLNAQISALRIDVDALKTVARINYFFADSKAELTNSAVNHTAFGAASQMGEK
ncbi:TolC family protein [Alteromonas sp. A081]|uniref:TolC family protein n=1 Tax=Alteromonas sp. A081 TaxID=3410269 RepID=UPI003B983637